LTRLASAATGAGTRPNRAVVVIVATQINLS